MPNGISAHRPRALPRLDRFMRHVQKVDGGCWLWMAHRNPWGYGRFHYTRNKPILAHRAAWRIFRGEIPPGLLVCHSCDNPACVKPDHLWLGTNLDNQRDSKRKGRNPNWDRTHCRKGHERTPENTRLVNSSGPVRRTCRICQRAREAARCQARRAARAS
jgi:hypothetical protein